MKNGRKHFMHRFNEGSGDESLLLLLALVLLLIVQLLLLLLLIVVKVVIASQWPIKCLNKTVAVRASHSFDCFSRRSMETSNEDCMVRTRYKSTVRIDHCSCPYQRTWMKRMTATTTPSSVENVRGLVAVRSYFLKFKK